MYIYTLYTKYIKKVFIFYEETNLIICLIIPFLALAFTNNVFETNITTLKKIYNLIILSKKS